MRPIVDIFTLLPFMVPVIVYVFGLIRTFSRQPFVLTETPTGTDVLIAGGYVVLAMPYMYRAIDIGMRSIDVRTLTEAAQSLGAGWTTIITRLILPNVLVAVLSGAFMTFAIVIGEYVFAALLNRPAFGPFMVWIGGNRAYEPAALAVIAFGITWACMGVIQLGTRLSRHTRAQR
jgi:putative spermidine/putrescine transport system permease protein